jgi:ProP effector
VGIKQDLVKLLSTREDIVIADKACMVNSLSYYVNSTAYHKSVSEGATRIDLDGNPAGNISAEEAKYSTECRQAKLQKKKPAPQQNKTKEQVSN